MSTVLLLAYGALCLALGFMAGFLVGTTEVRVIRRELGAIKRKVLGAG